MLLYTDGSAIGNPGPGGWAVIIQDGDEEHVLRGGEEHSTNNRMEMTAVLAALEWLGKKKPFPKEPITIRSDSNLIIHTVTKGWKRKKNQDIWTKIDKALATIAKRSPHATGAGGQGAIRWQWVKGHHTDRLNLRVDELAQQESRTRAKNASRAKQQPARVCQNGQQQLL